MVTRMQIGYPNGHWRTVEHAQPATSLMPLFHDAFRLPLSASRFPFSAFRLPVMYGSCVAKIGKLLSIVYQLNLSVLQVLYGNPHITFRKCDQEQCQTIEDGDLKMELTAP